MGRVQARGSGAGSVSLRTPLACCVLWCLAASAPIAPVLATPLRLAAASRPLTLDEAVARAEREYHAHVVRAETRTIQGRMVYVLRLLNDAGRVWTVHIDAETGAAR